MMMRRPEFLMMRRPGFLMMRRPEFLMLRRPCAALRRPENKGRTVPILLLLTRHYLTYVLPIQLFTQIARLIKKKRLLLMKIEQTKIEPYWTQNLRRTQIRTHAFFLIMMSSWLAVVN
jgi:hypothetical protein